jgi:hypothetical protein
MRLNSEAIYGRSLRFRNADMEKRFQANRMSYDDLPCLGKALIWGTMIGASFRRLQLLYEAYSGQSPYDPNGELRITLEFFSGILLDILVYFIRSLAPIRGTALTIAAFWSVIDSSCFYYPKEPSLVPMYCSYLLR